MRIKTARPGSMSYRQFESTVGSNSRVAKLDEGRVWDILNSGASESVLAQKYAVSRSTIQKILSRTRWRHVKPDQPRPEN